MRYIFIVLILFISVVAKEIKKPNKEYMFSGSVIDMLYKDEKLYCATNKSSVEVMDIKSKKIVQTIKVKKIKDFMGDTIDAKIYSVDVYKKSILLLSQAKSSYREVYLFKNKKLINIISVDAKLDIARAKFLDNENIIFALLGNDIISYNIKTKKENWKIQASQSKFSYFTLNEKKSEIAVADESGDIHIYDTKSSKLLKVLSGQNLDNVFQVSYKNRTIATAGQDRRVVVYDRDSSSAYYKTSNFLIYSVALSPSAKLVAYASDENNNVTVFKTSTHTNLATFGGNEMTLSKIVFKNEHEFFVASDNKIVNYYKIK